jgi:hypothetical protein
MPGSVLTRRLGDLCIVAALLAAATPMPAQDVGELRGVRPALSVQGGVLDLEGEGMPRQGVAGIEAGLDLHRLVGIRGLYWRGVEEGVRGFDPIEAWGGEARLGAPLPAGITPYVALGGLWSASGRGTPPVRGRDGRTASPSFPGSVLPWAWGTAGSSEWARATTCWWTASPSCAARISPTTGSTGLGSPIASAGADRTAGRACGCAGPPSGARAGGHGCDRRRDPRGARRGPRLSERPAGYHPHPHRGGDHPPLRAR